MQRVPAPNWKFWKNEVDFGAGTQCGVFRVMPESVSSKRSYSVGGQTISKDRCNLYTETARELMRVKSCILNFNNG